MIEALDGIVSWMPFLARRTIVFSDCDPAGVVFAANYYRYALWAYDLFHDRYLKPVRDEVSMPVKAMSIVHMAPLRPGETVDLALRPVELGRTTFTVSIDGVSDGKEVFQSSLKLICKSEGAWSSCPLPTGVRETLQIQIEAKR